MDGQISIITFLGTSEYKECHYSLDGRTSSPCRFIQEALMEHFGDRFTGGSHFTVLLTEQARGRNWLNRSESGSALMDIGLRDRMKKIRREQRINVAIEPVDIPDGRSEDELWEIFKIVYDRIRDGDRIILDITHSFRSLPLLNLILLNYARFLKPEVELERVIYGALEALGKFQAIDELHLDERVVPIFDLTPFVSLFDWTIAVEKYLQTGNAVRLQELGKKSLKPILSSTKGKAGGDLRDLLDRLNFFSMDVATSRGPNMLRDLQKIKHVLSGAEKDIELVKPIEPLFEKLKGRFERFDISDEVRCNLDVVDWCCEKGLVQQGLTILRENIVNFVIMRYLVDLGLADLNNVNSRKIAEAALNRKFDIVDCTRRDIARQVADELQDGIRDLWLSVGQYRNDINHAGWTRNGHSGRDFMEKLSELNSTFREIVSSEMPPDG